MKAPTGAKEGCETFQRSGITVIEGITDEKRFVDLGSSRHLRRLESV